MFLGPLVGFGAGKPAYERRGALVGRASKDGRQVAHCPSFQGTSLGGALRKDSDPHQLRLGQCDA